MVLIWLVVKACAWVSPDMGYTQHPLRRVVIVTFQSHRLDYPLLLWRNTCHTFGIYSVLYSALICMYTYIYIYIHEYIWIYIYTYMSSKSLYIHVYPISWYYMNLHNYNIEQNMVCVIDIYRHVHTYVYIYVYTCI